MGKDSWTSRLAKVYGGNDKSFNAVSTLPVVNVDGPYLSY